MPGEATVALFAYGTLRQPGVQQATFGRLLAGRPDSLPGWTLRPLAITDAHVIAVSGSAMHAIAHRTGNPADSIPGTLFSITEAELAAADAYKVEDAMRIDVTLASGTQAFVYVSVQA